MSLDYSLSPYIAKIKLSGKEVLYHRTTFISEQHLVSGSYQIVHLNHTNTNVFSISVKSFTIKTTIDKKASTFARYSVNNACCTKATIKASEMR